VITRGDLEQEVLKLLEASNDAQALQRVGFWVDSGLQDAYTVIRPYWAIRAAIITVESDSTAFLPPSYLAMNGIFPLTGGKPLQAVTIEQAGPLFLQNVVCEPSSYLIEGTSITFLPLAQASAEYRLSYFSNLGPLSAPSDSTPWIERAGRALVFVCARYGALYMENDELAARCDGAFVSIAERINQDSVRARSGAGLVITRG
jgi:hypothetical protein